MKTEFAFTSRYAQRCGFARHGKALTRSVAHWQGFTSKVDEDIPVDSDRIKPFGTYTRKVYPYRPVAQTFWKHRRRARYIMAEDPRLV